MGTPVVSMSPTVTPTKDPARTPSTSPTPVPVVQPTAPTPSCVDLEIFSQKNGAQVGTQRTCSWVVEGQVSRCSQYAVECPATCSACPDTCEDSNTWAYTADRGREVDCSWVRRDPTTRCDVVGENGAIAWQVAFEACLVACGEC